MLRWAEAILDNFGLACLGVDVGAMSACLRTGAVVGPSTDGVAAGTGALSGGEPSFDFRRTTSLPLEKMFLLGLRLTALPDSDGEVRRSAVG